MTGRRPASWPSVLGRAQVGAPAERVVLAVADLRRLRAELAVVAARDAVERARRICELGVTEVPATGAAISVIADVHGRDVVFATDGHAIELEELQFELGEGPCVEAFGEGRPVLVADLAEVPSWRWPMFTAAAVARTPARAAYAFPLQAGAIKVGVLDLYRVDPGSLTRDELGAALLIADAALWSLLNSRAHPEPDQVTADAGEGVADRSGWPLVLQRDHRVVYQATGMVIAQTGASVENALAILRGYAFAHDRSLESVAVDVVARRLSFAGDEEDT